MATAGTSVRIQALAVSDYEGPPPVDGSFDDEDGDVERELPWVADLPEGDRRLFAEEMAHLMTEAAKTDDFTDVEQALRAWRATSEIYLDPALARRLAGPRWAYGERLRRWMTVFSPMKRKPRLMRRWQVWQRSGCYRG